MGLMKKFLIFIIFVLVVGLLWSVALSRKLGSDIMSVRVGNTLLDKVEVASTDAQKQQGLSGRDSISDNFVMIFPFDTPGYYDFWMKDMKFDIDIIWTDQRGVVTGLTKDAKPVSYPASFSPEAPSKYVLEVIAGIIEKEGLKMGDKVIFVK